jgi:hypothetical protein
LGILHGERQVQTQSWAPLPENLLWVNDAAKQSRQFRFTCSTTSTSGRSNGLFGV